MKNIILFILFFGVNHNFKTQKIKLENFELVQYSRWNFGKDIIIQRYSKFDTEGNLLACNCNKSFKNYSKFKLTNEEIKIINSLKNKKLDQYVTGESESSLDDKNFYITYRNKKKKEELIFILKNMSPEFKDVIYVLLEKIYSDQIKYDSEKFEIDKNKVKEEILGYQKRLYDALPEQERLYPHP